MSKAS
jgi:V-type H+-transporting ATPase subunit B